MATLSSRSASGKGVSAVFLPSVSEMYPSGITQDVDAQKGTFVEVKGYGHQMEGKSRPTFFRGVATVVMKLFNVVQPTHAYFGQKDIQQALILRHMCTDLLLSHPTPSSLRIIPTTRNPFTNLALSSRNAYLSPSEFKFAPTLYEALQIAKGVWEKQGSAEEATDKATQMVRERVRKAEQDGVVMKLDYLEVSDAGSFEPVCLRKDSQGRAVILSGAMWVGSTRLIDNVVIEDDAGGIISY